ncbi:DUF1840 domain-containing protein [Photobacterium sanctipauli]|uniref:DUF1840 domain-containing protein n=1 Tax=Photobacterium sanctipauli TaxID=1342794 RepID=A0A2T3NV86_9GAMM|nr:DUF1840 domain-containing protein [Photobacterium sanctipauli]PSW20151.1 DUF1840 domain-containing protein [Photobacterium sanctipauli]
MLVTFKCKASGNVLMFGDVAKHMLRMMGHCENIPGAIDPADIDDALIKLTAATQQIHQQELAAEKQQVENSQSAEDVDDLNELDVEPVVSLYTRAAPLIDMLKAARDAECHIMWHEGT